MRKEIGKIESIRFGKGGYQDAMVGVTFNLTGPSWGVSDFWGYWGFERSGTEKWTDHERQLHLGGVVMRISSLMSQAGVSDFTELKGKPVEAEFGPNTLISWRILTEVL